MTRLAAENKILPVEQVDRWVEKERAAGHRIGFTCGAFDVMHAGHAQYLAEARNTCDRLLVAVNSDASIQRYKNPLRPINPWNERAFVVASMASVDRVTVLDEDRPSSLILRWKPEFYIKGGDYKTSALRSGSAVEEYGGKTILIPPQFAASTTAMYERIQALAVHAIPEKAKNQKPAGLVLLDRDGTLVRDAGFDPSKVGLLPGVGEALRELQAAGFRLCLVTNQQGIGLGYFGYRDFVDGNRALLRRLGEERVSIAKIYFCPHSLADVCNCRKPFPGLILRALSEENVPAARCFVIGDSLSDMEAARNAGCRGYYVGPSTPEYPGMSITEASTQIRATG
ncbi:MAG TPA: HAD-IIIA family hydrolase [Bryobacteraceae bacterium]|jgi:rfaE bifunctional protein nucleotidyltransferase chain/domain